MYAVVVIVLINLFGIAGAAAAWSFRVIFDAFAVIWFSKRIAGVPFRLFNHFSNLLVGDLMLLPPALFAYYSNFSFWFLLWYQYV